MQSRTAVFYPRQVTAALNTWRERFLILSLPYFTSRATSNKSPLLLRDLATL